MIVLPTDMLRQAIDALEGEAIAEGHIAGLRSVQAGLLQGPVALI